MIGTLNNKNKFHLAVGSRNAFGKVLLRCGKINHKRKDRITEKLDGFGGLVVSMLAPGSRVRGFDPDRSRCIFSDVKKSSACLPSERK
jgi:hypothetical protein